MGQVTLLGDILEFTDFYHTIFTHRSQSWNSSNYLSFLCGIFPL